MSKEADEIQKALGKEFKVVDLVGPDTLRKDPVWTCKIGILGETRLKSGADAPMRRAVEKAFFDLTGVEAQFTFSGWGGELTEGERDIVEKK